MFVSSTLEKGTIN